MTEEPTTDAEEQHEEHRQGTISVPALDPEDSEPIEVDQEGEHIGYLREEPEPKDPLAHDLRPGDPVVDLATGRNLIVVRRTADRSDEFDERQSYDFLGNYGNERLRAQPADPVYECVYVAGLGSKPTKSYDFPSARLGRPRYENVDGVRRVYDEVTEDLLRRMFRVAEGLELSSPDEVEVLSAIAGAAGVPTELIEEAGELAEIDLQEETDG